MASFLDPNDPRLKGGAGGLPTMGVDPIPTGGGDWFRQQGAPTGGQSISTDPQGGWMSPLGGGGGITPMPTGGGWGSANDPADVLRFGTRNPDGTYTFNGQTYDPFHTQGAPTGGGYATINDPKWPGAQPTTDIYGNPLSQPGAPTGGWGGPGPIPADLVGGGVTGRFPTAGQQGGAAPPGGQNYQQIVEQLMGGSNDPAKLQQIAPQLAQYGITLSNPNASGDLSKIILPDGTPIRVIGAGEGHAVWTPQPGTWGPGGVPQGGQSGNGMSPLGALAGGLDPSAAGRLGYSGGLGLNVDVTQDPSYQFRLQQGQQALERSAAAKGTLLTGGTAKALARYGQDMASTEYGNVYNRALGENNEAYRRLFGEQVNRGNQLLGLSQIGINAAGTQANLGQNYGNQAGNLLNNQATNQTNLITGAGNAASAGTIAQGNAWNQGLNAAGTAGNQAAQYYYLSRLFPGGGAGTIPTPPYGTGGLT